MSTPAEPPAAGAQPLRIGQRVRSTNDAPVFASDPRAGDLGRIQDARGADAHGIDTTSYLVRWESGLESWAPGATLEPLRMGALGSLPTTSPGDGAARPRPATPARRPGFRKAQGLIAIPIILVTFGPGIFHFLHHPSFSGQAWFLVVPLFIVVNAVLGRRRRGRPTRTPPPP
jgi:hypothetical protein